MNLVEMRAIFDSNCLLSVEDKQDAINIALERSRNADSEAERIQAAESYRLLSTSL